MFHDKIDQAKAALLQPVQALPTSGARAVQPFNRDNTAYLAVPQRAEDVHGAPPDMHGGNSDVSLIIYKFNGEEFAPMQELPVTGGADAEYFVIGARAFLATASLRSGSAAPYDLNADSTLYEWQDGAFVPFQKFPTFAARQWRYFQIGARHFLALAQGAVVEGVTPKNPPQSMIFAWNGATFEHFQTVPSAWGYNWQHIRVEGQDYLAYADNHEPSIVLRWDGVTFKPFQILDGESGRAFCFFQAEGNAYLAFANLLGDTLLYCWEEGRCKRHQTLSGPGGCAFAYMELKGRPYLLQANYMTGSPKAPNTALQSVLYRFEGGYFTEVETLSTCGATDAAAFKIGHEQFVAVAEGLSAEVRFRTDTRIYHVRKV